MKLYHSTNSDAADAIEREGFRDAPNGELTGVFFSETAADYGSEAIFEVDIPDDIAAEYFLNYEDDDGQPDPDAPREWCFPAAVVNSHPRRRLAEEE